MAPRTAQAAMRHSTIDLTMNTYTDPRLLDVHGALDALPALPIDGSNTSEAKRATGTDHSIAGLHQFAPGFAPTPDKSSESGAIGDKRQTTSDNRHAAKDSVVSAYPVKRKQPLSLADNGCRKVETKGLEPSTPGLQSRCSPN